MKPVTARLRGLWRLWALLSAAWVVFVAVRSDLACPLLAIGIDLGAGPWCQYQLAEPVSYYGNLVLRMIGPPLLGAAALAGGAWVYAGFRSE